MEPKSVALNRFFFAKEKTDKNIFNISLYRTCYVTEIWKILGMLLPPEIITRSSCCIEGMAFIFITYFFYFISFYFILKVWKLKLPQPPRPCLAWEVSFCNFKFQNCGPLCSFYQAPQRFNMKLHNSLLTYF